MDRILGPSGRQPKSAYFTFFTQRLTGKKLRPQLMSLKVIALDRESIFVCQIPFSGFIIILKSASGMLKDLRRNSGPL